MVLALRHADADVEAVRARRVSHRSEVAARDVHALVEVERVQRLLVGRGEARAVRARGPGGIAWREDLAEDDE